jgi:hypothetical protein
MWPSRQVPASQPESGSDADLVLYFGSSDRLAERGLFARLRHEFPKAILLGCSTGGQIVRGGVEDDAVCGLALGFDHATARLYRQPVGSDTDSFAAGVNIGTSLAGDDLAGVIVLSDGLRINGSELAEGIASALPPGTPVAGGLAGDGNRFARTLVGANCSPTSGMVAAVGLYGAGLAFRTGSGGGWTVFGPRRKITASNRNVLHTLDGMPAIELYDTYLGPEAGQLPGSGLRFPLLIRDPGGKALIRTLLAVDRQRGTLTFAGNLPEGWTAQLMRANFERLSEGAGSAVRSIGGTAEAALLVSCIGRRLVLGQRTEDEIDAVEAGLGTEAPIAGFYSYGEFAASQAGGPVELHNQTMTVLTLSEARA